MNKHWVRICVAVVAMSSLAGCSGTVSNTTEAVSPLNSAVLAATASDQLVQTATWPGVVYAAYQTDKADYAGSDLSADEFTIGNQDDVSNFAFLRLSLGGDFMANELQDARLHLKVVSGSVPSSINLTMIKAPWVPTYMYQDEAKQLVADNGTITVPVTQEADDWISIPLTDQVKSWLAGEIANSGFQLTSDANGTFAVATGNDDPADTPYVSAKGAIGNRATNYGKFAYTEALGPDDVESANCLAYALRHNTPIYVEDMGSSYEELEAAYIEGGLPAQVEKTAQRVEGYVNSHKAELQLSKFRRLEAFDSPIDPTTEYRMALRGGREPFRELPDYHFWAQLDDGRWAQKFPWDDSEIIVGTGAGLSPDDFIWNGGRLWGYDRTTNRYTSDVIYWAVTKDATEFTD